MAADHEFAVTDISGLEVAVDGGRLITWWLSEGPGDPVIAIHGITATSRSWLAVARSLAGRARLAAPDLRGRGASRALPPPYGLDAHAADVIAVLDALGLERAVLAGHSLGAYVACRVAARYPDRVARLVLVDGGVPLPGAGEIPDPDAVIAATLGPAMARLRTGFPDRGAYRAWWAAHPALADSDVDPELLAAYADYDLCGEAPHLHSSVNPEVVPTDGRDLLQTLDGDRITTQAILLHAPHGLDGAPPALLPAERVSAWACARPDRRAVLVPGSNHYTIAMGEAGARVVADELLAALAAHDDGPALA